MMDPHVPDASEVASPRGANRPQAPRLFIWLIGLTTLLVGTIIYPFATELFLAAVLAGFLFPLQQYLSRKLRGRRHLAAGLVSLLMLMLLLVPIGVGLLFVLRDGSESLEFIREVIQSERVSRMIEALPQSAREVATSAIASFPHGLSQAVSRIDLSLGRDAATFLGATALSATLMLIAMFFLLVRGAELLHWIDSVSPLRRGHTNELLANFKTVSRSVITSSVLTSAIQALAGLAGFLIAGIPNPIFFTSATFVFAFIPAIGAGSVCLVAAFLLYATGHSYMALFLAIWGAVVVGLVDNLVKPLALKRGMEMHGALVFFALLGGLATFGAVGLLLGPLILSMFVTVLRMYHLDFMDHRDARAPSQAVACE